jgi:excisionase family DNA binding protein
MTTAAAAVLRDFITVPEAARELGVSRQRAYVLARRGKLGPVVVVGGRLLVRRADVQRRRAVTAAAVAVGLDNGVAVCL